MLFPSFLAFLNIGLGELFLLLSLPMLAFWIWMLVDCLTQESDGTQKLVWAIVLFVTGILGAAIYFFARKLPRKSAST